MVSSLLVDSITHPDTVLRDFANGLKDADDLPARVSKYFADIFASDNAFKEVRSDTPSGFSNPDSHP